jgi:capsid protein
VNAFTTMIGAALEISPEVLMKKFSNNFSASKGALNETWRAFSMRRKWFVDDFCQEVYELWFAEAVSIGRIQAPGFFADPLIRKAYTNATWTGPAQGCLNPVQEVNAAVTRITNGLSTREDECAAINGSDYEDNVRTLENENELLARVNKALESAADEETKILPPGFLPGQGTGGNT